jgi:hypothetical protein
VSRLRLRCHHTFASKIIKVKQPTWPSVLRSSKERVTLFTRKTEKEKARQWKPIALMLGQHFLSLQSQRLNNNMWGWCFWKPQQNVLHVQHIGVEPYLREATIGDVGRRPHKVSSTKPHHAPRASAIWTDDLTFIFNDAFPQEDGGLTKGRSLGLMACKRLSDDENDVRGLFNTEGPIRAKGQRTQGIGHR